MADEKEKPKDKLATAMANCVLQGCAALFKKIMPDLIAFIRRTIELEVARKFKEMHSDPDKPVVHPYKLTKAQMKKLRQSAIKWALKSKAEDLIPLIEQSDERLLVDISSESPIVIEGILAANFLDPDL